MSDAPIDRAGERVSKPRFSLPNWKRRLCLTLVASMLIGAGVYGAMKHPAQVYQATARVLLLSQQEQYLVKQAAVVEEKAKARIDAEELDALLPSQSVAIDIADAFDLRSDPYFARRSVLDRILAFLGADLLISKSSAQLASNINQSIIVQPDPEKRIVKLGFLAPDAEQAAEIANRLASLYLANLKDNQKAELQQAVDKLAEDVNQLASHRNRLLDRIRRIQAQLSRTNLATAEPGLDEGEQLVSLIAQERAQKSMLNRMMARQREAETRLELDLLPPRARLLSQATAPTRVIHDPAALYGLLVALLFLSANALRWFRLMSKASGDVSAKPKAAKRQAPKWSEVISVKIKSKVGLTAKNAGEGRSDDEQSPAEQSGEREKTEPIEPRPNNRLALHRLALSGVGGHVSDIARLASKHTSKRVVLISEEPDWGDLGTDTLKSFANAGLRIIHVGLDENRTFNRKQSGKLRVGLSDLIDDLARGGDLIHGDGATGICSVSVGYRSLHSEDFASEKLANFMQALETVFDIVFVDLGPFYSDEAALRAFGGGRSTVACIHAPLSDINLIKQINDVMCDFGYSESLILPLGPRLLKQRIAKMRQSPTPVAAE
ncbi:hypothetical protein [Cohaesibacter sp. ES.047]|uniref:hypothetical protein n=1 Tax=Cohaesibacter sp. ES.047 TaxID=1798205 RepID=UPI0012FDB891|nr:hypothetical protein [Cohaesibacter sp. ES.047]